MADATPESNAKPTEDPKESPLRSVHSTTFPQLLKELGICVLVSTYQAGKLVTLRCDNELLNTHFADFISPMGLACDGGRLAIGTRVQVWELHNQACNIRAW